MPTPKKASHGGALTLGILGATVAAGAAAYFFLGPKGAKHKKQAKAWAIKMKGDVVEKLEKVSEVSEPVYHEIINSVASEYEKGKRASQSEIAELAADLKKHWKTLSHSAKSLKKDAVKTAKRVKTAATI